MVRYDAIVIGAGMSGLAAGIRLAQFDRRVAILEKHYVWGGLTSFYGKGKYAFDVGLHALTNYVPAGTRGAPLTRALKQLRLRHADLELGEQGHSEILFPGVRLRFTNDPAVLIDEVGRAFPAEAGRFQALWREMAESEWDVPSPTPVSARARLAERLRDPLLAEMLLLPLCYYGSALENDVDWGQFKILFRSIFVEGLARPEGGVRRLLNLLVKRYRSLGGELRLRAGVRAIDVDGGCARGVVLDDGTELEADVVLSSAGFVETMRLCGDAVLRERTKPSDRGRLTFLESISVLDRAPVELGHTAATCFYSTRERFAYASPEGLVDLTSGLVCAPNNFASREPMKDALLRTTVLANGDAWCKLPNDEYAARKEEAAEAAIASFAAFAAREAFPGGERRDWRAHTVFRDVFTPRTIQSFTGHPSGCVYGSPVKRGDGETGIPGLYLCGTDQGYLGVVGALNSGILMANRHALIPA
jgi:phytoene dehydrogenase-like protein